VTYFEDLTPYSYWPNTTEEAVNVGWLSGSHSFPVGDTPAGLVPAILHIVAAGPVNRTRGWHRCELCNDPDYPIRMDVDGRSLSLGDAEIRVTGQDGTVYAAPSLIAHYVSEHRYLPPAPFVEAVLRGAQSPP
jgi:hypothetical protein